MAYSSKLTPMNGQRPHDGYYGPAQRGYGPARGHGNERRREPSEPSYSSHVQYAEHDQSSWSPQEQYSNGDRGYEPSQRDWQNGRFYGEPSHQKLRTAAPRNGNEQRNRQPRPFPGSQVQGEDYDQGYDNYNSWRDHEQTHHQRREEPQWRYQESQDHQHDGTGFDPRQRPAPMSNPRPPRNDSNLKYGSEEDQLPRYLNHGESRRGTDGGAQHRRNDFSRSPNPLPSSHARPIDPRSASSCKFSVFAPHPLVLLLINVQPHHGRKESWKTLSLQKHFHGIILSRRFHPSLRKVPRVTPTAYTLLPLRQA